MEEKMESFHKNQTWLLVDRPRTKNIVDCKWVYKYNKGISGIEESRRKARLMAHDFSQGSKTYTSIQTLLALVAIHDLKLEQLDVKEAFLH